MMDFSIVMLWTDILLWILFAVLLLGIRSIKRSDQARKQWRKIFESPIAMAAALVLGCYFMIAMFDSVHLRFDPKPQESVESLNGLQHFQQTVNQRLAASVDSNLHGKTLSLLDIGVQHLILATERTYSAPFALTEYSSSVVYGNQGVEQQFKPLKFAGQHLKNEDSLQVDLILKTLYVFVFSIFMTILLWLLHGYFRIRAFISTPVGVKLAPLPWKAFYLTLFLLIFVLSWFYSLSHYYHVLGTDKVGQDVLYQSLKAIRTGVMIGLLTTLVMLPLALFLGISAGYFKGLVDDLIQYLYTTLNSIPGVLLIAAAVLVMQSILNTHSDWFGSTEERADLRLLFLILILGITSWTGLCRLLRAETLKISQIEYVSAAKAFGLGGFSIIRRHIMPNLMHLVLIALVLDFSGLVLAEAVLSYVGVGVDPTTPSWGNMINQARLEMAREPMVWWSLLSAFGFMFILVLAANLFSDRVQWVLDPRSH
ncbi:peptide ABC transporter permease [Thiosulfatimonas sediminis]|uniref:Peptide ABC transporter permease n=1 Tax=Thiosulfatimonas sediminis TaxID=2675054 RepID=A0A6F8PV57_9GAMM|nr:ABC transporter permease [Thiosulfatimonas sediminis]BBP45999.1 peptide ABC transporter permease [Thiosulfatimonas sediminis]